MWLGSIRLETGETCDVGRIVVGEWGSLRARVARADGAPLDSGWLDVLSLAGWQVSGVPIQAGTARVAKVAPGDYLVRAQGDRSQDRALRRITIRVAQETEAD